MRLDRRVSAVLIHTVIIGTRTMALDLVTGDAYEYEGTTLRRRLLGAAETRILLLDWTQRWMPVETPAVCWILEAALLASQCNGDEWRMWAMTHLHEGIRSLPQTKVDFPAGTGDLLRQAGLAVDSDAGEIDAELLASIAERIALTLQSCAQAPRPDLSPLSAVIEGRSELEWDRVRPIGVDRREHGVRSQVSGTVWTGSVEQHVSLDRNALPIRLWARLVDSDSGQIYDCVEMHRRGELFVAHGYVSADARETSVRVDITSEPDSIPRDQRQHLCVAAEQSWFRALALARMATARAAWNPWAEAHRVQAQSRLAAVITDGGCVQKADVIRLPNNLARQAPFLAEMLLRPELIASSQRAGVPPAPVTPHGQSTAVDDMHAERKTRP